MATLVLYIMTELAVESLLFVTGRPTALSSKASSHKGSPGTVETTSRAGSPRCGVLLAGNGLLAKSGILPLSFFQKSIVLIFKVRFRDSRQKRTFRKCENKCLNLAAKQVKT